MVGGGKKVGGECPLSCLQVTWLDCGVGLEGASSCHVSESFQETDVTGHIFSDLSVRYTVMDGELPTLPKRDECIRA